MFFLGFFENCVYKYVRASEKNCRQSRILVDSPGGRLKKKKLRETPAWDKAAVELPFESCKDHCGNAYHGYLGLKLPWPQGAASHQSHKVTLLINLNKK